MKIHNIHDSGFKAMYLIREIAQAHVEKLVDTEIAEQIDFEHFHLESTAYINEYFQATFSDIVYSAQLKSGEALKLVFLFEHKSYSDANIHVQVGGYIFSILNQAYQQKEEYPIVIPIVVYHGKTKWKHKKLSEYFEQLPPFLRRFLPDFELIVSDLSDYSDDFLLKLLKDKLLLNALLTLKHGKDDSYIVHSFNRLITGMNEQIDSEIVRNLFQIIFFYLKGVSSLSELELATLFHYTSNKNQSMIDRLLADLEAKSPVELLGREADLLRAKYRAEFAEKIAEERKKEVKVVKEELKVAQKEIKVAQKEIKVAQKEIRVAKEEAEQVVINAIKFLSKEQHTPEVIANIVNKSVKYVKETLQKINDKDLSN